MMGKTHLAIGLLAALVVYVFIPSLSILFFPLVMLGALLPDVDHEGSMINKRLPLTRWISFLFEHRGFFHSVFPVVIIVVISVFTSVPWIGFAIALGYLSHLASDSLTHLGTRPFHPLSQFAFRGFVTTGGVMEFIILIVVAAADIWILVRNGLVV
jgi:inner membrane protein